MHFRLILVYDEKTFSSFSLLEIKGNLKIYLTSGMEKFLISVSDERAKMHRKMSYHNFYFEFYLDF